MNIELKVVELVRETAASAWVKRVLDTQTYTIEGHQSDTFAPYIGERDKRGEPLYVITFECRRMPEVQA